jgi:hypothetical protein
VPHDDAPDGAFDDVLRFDVDGQVVEYYPAGSELPVLLTTDLRGYEYRIDVALDHHPRLRRAAVWFRLPGDVVRIFGALHWADGRDLDALDRELQADTVDPDRPESPFDVALFTVASDVTCQVCHSSSLVAVVDSALPLVSPARERQHPVSTHCPACGADRFRPHVEVLAS